LFLSSIHVLSFLLFLNIDKILLYLGIRETKARELMTKTNNPYTIRVGNRLFANKKLLDKWLDKKSGNIVA